MAAKLLASLFALYCGSVVAECDTCTVSDEMDLHQHAVRLRSLSHGESPPAEAPSKAQIAHVKPEIKSALEGIFQRSTVKLNLPHVPAVFRWELVGKATDLALNRYKKPKTAAARELLEGIIDLVAEVAGSKEFVTMQDAELNARLGNITRLHHLIRHFAEQRNAPPAVTKLLDAVAEAGESKGTMDPAATKQTLLDVANQTGGPALAELLSYNNDLASGKATLDLGHLVDLYVPVFNRFGAPPAVDAYLRETSEMIKGKLPVNPAAEPARAQRMMAKAAKELKLPSAMSDALDYMADLAAGNATELLKPEDGVKILVKLDGFLAELNDQIGGPAAISELVRRCAAPVATQTAGPTPTETLTLLAKASHEMSFPSAVSEFLEYLSEVSAKSGSPDPERIHDLLVKLSEQAGAPEPLAKFSKDLASLKKKEDGSVDPNKLSKLITSLLKKLGLPAFGDLFAKIVGPMLLKGKQPDALALAAAAPSLTKILPDLETAHGLVQDVRKKLFAPLMSFYEQAVEKITGQMPDSLVKTAFRSVLSLAKPPH